MNLRILKINYQDRLVLFRLGFEDLFDLEQRVYGSWKDVIWLSHMDEKTNRLVTKLEQL